MILRANPSEIGEGTGREDCETWDSLSHLNIVLAVEEQYGVGYLLLKKSKAYTP